MRPAVEAPSKWWLAGKPGFLTASRAEPLHGPTTQIRAGLHRSAPEENVGAHSHKAWDSLSLRQLVRERLPGQQIMVVSNRQPHSHIRDDKGVRIEQTAGGLVTALEPVIRACEGTWIAHGSGNADREVVDRSSGWTAADAAGSYRLRRVWLSALQQRGHGDGFSNAGLWPLCHLAHVKPRFSQADWLQYVDVNRLFAQAVVSESRGPDPIVLVQDYHLALVPAMVRKQMPAATVVSFWHIPWTHNEQMSQCPWLEEIVNGLMGSDIVAFQTAQHAGNFSSSARSAGLAVDARCAQGPRQSSPNPLVRNYPISIAWPEQKGLHLADAADVCPCPVRRQYGVPENTKLIVGVDRLDYTKGLVQRMHALEELLLTRPQWRGRVRLVQVAAPTRTGVGGYSALHSQLRCEVARINARFSTDGVEPILLLDQHHGRDTLDALYRAADMCLITSLHDGMNLVSKEFVAAREDEHGVLVLSQFAGAAHELTQALIVNPFNINQVSQALHCGLVMPREQQRERMRALRETVKSCNVFRWAARMLLDVAMLRDAAPLQTPKKAAAHSLTAR